MTSRQQQQQDESKQDNDANHLDRADSSSNFPTQLHYRFVRLNPRHDQEETLKLLKQELADSGCIKSRQDDDSNKHDDFPCPVTWLPSDYSAFYALPVSFPLVQSTLYQSGRIYGQDVSSGAAVSVLLNAVCPNPRQQRTENESGKKARTTNTKSFPLRILDLCCAPGQKLMALADGIFVQQQHSQQDKSETATSAVVVGVDVSLDRLAICQKALRRYIAPPPCLEDSSTATTTTTNIATQLSTTSPPSPPPTLSSRIRLYCADGTTFGQNVKDRFHLVWDSVVAQEDTSSGRKRLNKSARKRQQKQLQAVTDWDWATTTRANTKESILDEKPDATTTTTTTTAIDLFDAVLVDAECSTDGSIKHVQKRRRLEWTEERLPELVELQKRLAASGFRLLKPGGFMVYATCSLSWDQNEGVVGWLLKEFDGDVELVPVTFSSAPTSVQAGNIEGTVRFLPSNDPSHLTGGGFFLAKIFKKVRQI